MEKQNLKIMSVRLDPQTIEKIERFATRNRYWKKNAVINNILTTVINDFEEKSVYDMCRRNYFKEESVEARYEIQNLMHYVNK